MLKAFLSRSRVWGCGLLLAVLAGGCGYTPLSTMYALQKVDMMTTPATAFRVMVEMPGFARPIPGETVIELLEAGREEGVKIHLVPAPQEQKVERAKRQARLFVYRISPADIAVFHRFRAAHGEEDDEGGELSAKAGICRTTDRIPDHAFVTIYLKTAELADYVPLVWDIDMRDEASAGEIREALPLCEE
jgi:hypothetical protein